MMNSSRRTLSPAFTSLDLLIVVAVLAILVALLAPGYTNDKVRATRIACVCNLKQIGLSFRTWATDHQDENPMAISVTNGGTLELVGNASIHFQVMSNELSTPRILVCPEDKRRTQAVAFGPGFSDSNVSYFVGIDATPNKFDRVLTGDDHMEINGTPVARGLVSVETNSAVSWTRTRHLGHGNIGLADGSVQQVSSARLAEALRNTGMETNRLVFP
jgi:prepilin-type processing-associated H-X9-DG protein